MASASISSADCIGQAGTALVLSYQPPLTSLGLVTATYRRPLAISLYHLKVGIGVSFAYHSLQKSIFGNGIYILAENYNLGDLIIINNYLFDDIFSGIITKHMDI